MKTMRFLPFVLIVAFVFASAALLVPATSAQGGGSSLEGQVCMQSSYGYPEPKPAGGGSTTSCSYSGQGIPAATVSLTKPGPVGPVPVGGFNQSDPTDEGGYFAFSGLDAGDYTLRVDRTGFDSVSFTITLAAGGNHRDVILTAKTVQAAGKITDASGTAVSAAEVQFCCMNDQVVARTGTDGRFSASLQAGWWSIYVQAPGFQSFSDYRFIDGTELATIALERVPPTDATVRGTVSDQDGNPVSGARVAAYTYGGGCYGSEPQPSGSSSSTEPASSPPCYDRAYYGGENFTLSDSQGKYVLGVYSGEGSLSVQKDGYASYNLNLQIASGEDKTQDLTIKKFPEKTAHIVGKITSGGDPVRYAYLSVNSPEYGIYECSMEASSQTSGSGPSGSSGSPDGVASSSMPYPYNPGCAITMNADGTFDGMVTPGYSILSVYVDSYRACSETSDSDGDYSRTCGPEYYSWSRTMTLAADDTTRIDISLRARPEPNAVVSGYIVDAESGKALAGATISFSNADTYGYGYATTDQDGSYKLRLRAGYHQIYAYAEGHLHWEGTLDIAKGDTPFDVKLTPGQESYGGGCCYAYASDAGMSKEGAPMAVAAPAPSGAPQASGDTSSDGSVQGESYEDLGGGLGPYDASKRQAELASGGDGSNGAPAPSLALVLAGLAGAALAVRRRKA